MFDKLNRLSFIIGVFFFILGIILAVNALVGGPVDKLGLYTAAAFLLFGATMILVK